MGNCKRPLRHVRAGQAAVLPDFVWVASVIKTRSFSLQTAESRYERWHKRIQKYEFPGGFYIEVFLATILSYFVILQTI